MAKIDQKILLITPKGRETETVTRLARIGFDQVYGYLLGGFESWLKTGKLFDKINTESAETMLQKTVNKTEIIVDVRKPSEFEAGHIDGARSFPLDFLESQLSDFPTNGKAHIHCLSGYRSVIAASILKANGFDNIVNVNGGYKAVKEIDASIIKTA